MPKLLIYISVKFNCCNINLFVYLSEKNIHLKLLMYHTHITTVAMINNNQVDETFTIFI